MEHKTKNITKFILALLMLGASSSYGNFFHGLIAQYQPKAPVKIEQGIDKAAQKTNCAAAKFRKNLVEKPCRTVMQTVFFGCKLIKYGYYVIPIVALLPFNPGFSAQRMKGFNHFVTGYWLEIAKKYGNKGLLNYLIGPKSYAYKTLSYADGLIEKTQKSIEQYANTPELTHSNPIFGWEEPIVEPENPVQNPEEEFVYEYEEYVEDPSVKKEGYF